MLKSSLIYVFSSVLSSALPFILLPILTRYLNPEEYGKIAMFTILTAGLTSIIGLSVNGSANRKFFDKDVSEKDISIFNANCILILFVTVTLTTLLVCFFDNLISDFLNIPISWLYFGIINVFFVFLLNFRLGQWQIRDKAIFYGGTQIINAFLILILSLLFIIFFDGGAEGRIHAILITSVVIGVVSYKSLQKDKLFLYVYKKEDIKEALSFGIPIIPHVLGGFFLMSIDRLIISKELGINAAGVYMVAISLGGALNVLFHSVNKSYSPWLFSKLKENNTDEKKKIVRNTYIYFIVLFSFIFPIYYVTPIFVNIVIGPEFQDIVYFLPIIFLGQLFVGMYLMVTNYIFYVKKTKFLSFITILTGLFNVFLLYYLMPTHGLKGAAIAFMISSFLQFISTWFLSAKLMAMPWLLWKYK